MRKILRLIPLFFFYSFLPGAVDAQVQVSEQEIKLQEVFIEANREKVLGNFEEAIALYKKVLKEDRNNHTAAYEIARIYVLQDDLTKAQEYIKRALEERPDNPWYNKFIAHIHEESGSFAAAASVYQKLIERQPDEKDYYFKRAYYLVKADRIAKAIEVYDQLEARNGVSEKVIRRKHNLYLGMGENQQAAKELQRLVEAYPTNTDYLELLAGFYERVNAPNKAREVYQRILRIDPDNGKAQLALAGSSQKHADNAKYLQSLRAVFEKPNVGIDPKIQRLMPIVNEVVESEDTALARQALELTEILQDQHPTEAKSYAVTADLLYYSGQPEAALEEYRKTLELDDTNFLVWEQVLTICLELEQYEQLRDFSQSALDLFPNKAFVNYMNGLALHHLGKVREASGGLEMALLMAGNDGRMQFKIQRALGNVYHELEEYDQSEAAFESALELNASAPFVLNDYSYALARRGVRLKEAEQMIAKANELLPQNPSIEDTYGWVYYQMEQYDQAQQWLQKALEHSERENPLILEHYGDLLFQRGKQEEALRYWNQAMEKGSTSELLKKKIADRQLYE